MNNWSSFDNLLRAYLAVLLITAGVLAAIWTANWLLLRRRSDMGAEARIPGRF